MGQRARGLEVGIRNWEVGKLDCGMPPATYESESLHTDIFEMAAGYLFHMVKNHPFVDGNKRVGAVAALIFFDLNGFDAGITQFSDRNPGY